MGVLTVAMVNKRISARVLGVPVPPPRPERNTGVGHMLAAERLPGAAYGAAFDTASIRRLATAWMSHLDHDTTVTGVSVSRAQGCGVAVSISPLTAWTATRCLRGHKSFRCRRR
jgi:hypothetical protein